MPLTSRSATDWPLVWLLFLVGVAVAAQIGKVPPTLPLIRAELGIDLRAAGWFVSLVNLTTALAGVLAGLTADRVGHRRLVIGGLVVGLAASALGALTNDVVLLFVCRVAEGAGLLAVVVSLPSMLLRISAGHDAPSVMALWGTYLPAGAGLMALACAGLLTVAGWRGVWWATVAVLTIAVLAILWSQAGRGANAPSRSGGA
ncbi:MAG TPA: MFS transporter, partial [Vineibacter sp.]|nr:MFS transporter [Vineibacter sp.]